MKLWLSRLLVGMVFAWNVQCGLVFISFPARFAAGFQLGGAAGEAVIRGLGVLFLMWSVPYGVALWHPVRHRMALFEAIVMQGTGVVGESWILSTLPAIENEIARQSLGRFIIFDGLGLAALALAAWISRKS